MSKNTEAIKTIKGECLKTIRQYRRYKKVPFDSFCYMTNARIKGEYLLARRISRIIRGIKE